MNPLQALWEGFARLFGAQARVPEVTVLDVLPGRRPGWEYLGNGVARFTHDSTIVISAHEVARPGGRTKVEIQSSRGNWGGLGTSDGGSDLDGGRWPDGPWLKDIFVVGRPGALASLLDPFVRSNLPSLHTLGIRIDRCAVTVTVQLEPPDWPAIRDALEGAADLAVRIETARHHLEERLQDRLSDPAPEVRLHAAELLFERRGPGEDEEVDGLLLRCGDPKIVARTVARLPGGWDRLMMIARDPHERPESRSAAARVLLKWLPQGADAINSVLKQLRYHEGLPVALAALDTGKAEVRAEAMNRLFQDAGTRTGRTLLLRRLDDVLAVLPPGKAYAEARRDTLLRLGQAARNAAVVSVARALLEQGEQATAARLVDALLQELGDDHDWSTGALQVLGRLEPTTVTEARLRKLLDRRRPAVWRWALELARHHGHRDLAIAVSGFELWMDPLDADSFARLLGRLGGTAARAQLRRLLDHRFDADLRLAAIDGLGDCGELADVEALLQAEDQERGDRRDAARAAIERIQDRVGPAERGALALVEEDEAGRLTVAGQGGDLAIVDE